MAEPKGNTDATLPEASINTPETQTGAIPSDQNAPGSVMEDIASELPNISELADVPAPSTDPLPENLEPAAQTTVESLGGITAPASAPDAGTAAPASETPTPDAQSPETEASTAATVDTLDTSDALQYAAKMEVPEDQSQIAAELVSIFYVSDEAKDVRASGNFDPAALKTSFDAWLASDAVKAIPMTKAYDALPDEKKLTAETFVATYDQVDMQMDFMMAAVNFMAAPENKDVLTIEQTLTTEALRTRIGEWVASSKDPEIKTYQDSVNAMLEKPQLRAVADQISTIILKSAKERSLAESPAPEPESPLASAIVPENKTDLTRAIIQQFAMSAEGQALRGTADDKNPDAIQSAMNNWLALDVNKETEIVKAYGTFPAEEKPSAAMVKSEFESTNRTIDFDKAFTAFISSPQGRGVLMSDQTTSSKALMTQFKGWVNNSEDPEIIALKPSVNEAANTPALMSLYEGRLSELTTGAKQVYRASNPTPPPEEENLLKKNKFGGMGAILGMLAGLFLGGPIGALIGLLIGGLLGSSQDGDGLLNNFMAGEKPTAQRAKPLKMPNMPKGKELVMVRADGEATQDYREADVIYMGHQEGKGESREFVIENVMVRRNKDYAPDAGGEFFDVNNNPIIGARAMPMLHAATGRLKMTEGGTVDVTDANNIAVLKDAKDQGKEILKGERQNQLQAAGVERDNALQEAMVKDAPDAQTAIKQMQAAMMTRLKGMGVSAEDQARIASTLGEKYADPEFRAERSVEARLSDLMDEPIQTNDGNTRSIKEALLDPMNGGLTNEMGDGVQRFNRMFNSTSDNMVAAINALPGVATTRAPTPEIPNVARSATPDAATIPETLIEDIAKVTAPKAPELPTLALKQDTTSVTVADKDGISGAAKEKAAGVIVKETGDKAALRFAEIPLENGDTIMLSGKMQEGKFVADRIVSGNTVREAAETDSLKNAATRTFDVVDGNIAIDGENAKRVAAMLENGDIRGDVAKARDDAAASTSTAPAATPKGKSGEINARNNTL